MKVPISLHPCPHLYIFFMIIAILVGEMVVHCGFNLTNDIECSPQRFSVVTPLMHNPRKVDQESAFSLYLLLSQMGLMKRTVGQLVQPISGCVNKIVFPKHAFILLSIFFP